MRLITKIASFGLVLSLVLGGVCKTNRVFADSSSLSAEQKMVGGISAVGGINLLMCIGIGAWHHYHHLPVLIIGGDKDDRTRLIEKLKDSKPDVEGVVVGTLASVIEQKTANGVQYSEYYVRGTGKTRAQFKNWNINHCGAFDDSAPDLMKNARLIIALLNNGRDVFKIRELISQNVKRISCAVVSITDDELYLNPDVNVYRVPDDLHLDWNLPCNSFFSVHISY